MTFIYIVFLWGMPILITWWSFRKMDEEKRIEVIKEMKSMSALGVIACGIGLPIYFTGSVFALGIRGLQLLGIGLISFGWFWTWGLCLVKGKVTVSKSIAMIAVGILWIIFYSY